MVSTLLLLAAFLTDVAEAAPRTLFRDVSGETVRIGDRTLLVPWRLESTDDLAALRSTAALARELGVVVIGLNIDPAADKALLVPWLKSRGCDVPTLADPDGSIQARFSTRPGEVLVFAEGGKLLSRVLAKTSTEGIRGQVAVVLGVPSMLVALND